ncbi:uncharacterized protein tmem79a isoform 1-T2 [Pholidichthys leucotaenia]
MADLITDKSEMPFSAPGPVAEALIAESKMLEDSNSEEEQKVITGEEEEEEVSSSAHLEPSTLPYPGDKKKSTTTNQNDGDWSEKGGSEPEERDTGISAGSQDLSEDRQSQLESDIKRKEKWRESMPEGERRRDDEIEVHRDDKGEGSLADDEEEEEEEEEESTWISEKSAMGFTPHVMIVCPSGKEVPEERKSFTEKEVEREPEMKPRPSVEFYQDWKDQDDKCYICEHVCSDKTRLVLATIAALVLFPLLVWGGYTFLPFDSPLLQSAPLRVVYTLRCSFFASVPILLGVVVQGIARLRYSALRPLYESTMLNVEVVVHWHYVNESLALFLFFFVQLAVMATYISQEFVKLVPLLTIIFVFGRLAYWLCLSLGSSVRGLGFGFSFFPILVMLGVNLYYVCSSVGQGSVFDSELPATAAPPHRRLWG